MSTRCVVRIHDPKQENLTDCPVLVYHHKDGKPEFMLPKIKRFLEAAHAHLVDRDYAYAWNSPMVSALLVLLSVEDHEYPLMPFSTDRPDCSDVPFHEVRANGGLPEFLPVAVVTEDIEHLYDVWLSPISGSFRIDHTEVDPQQ